VQVLVDLIKEHPGPKDNGAQVKKSVEEEWRQWKSITNENEMIIHFSNSQVLYISYRYYVAVFPFLFTICICI
jgi:Mediator complex subunit 23